MGTKQQVIQSSLADFRRGMDLLDHPGLNKGTAFTDEERSNLGLHGLLPPHVENLEAQVVRAHEAYKRKDDDLKGHIYLRGLQDTDEVLFYRLLLEHIEEMTPMVYTPVVAQAVSSLVISIGGPAAYSFLTRCVVLSLHSCGIVLTRRST